MSRATRYAIAGIACLIAYGLGSAPASAAFTCGGSAAPLCTGAPSSTCSIATSKRCTTNGDCLPGEGTCTFRISGTATAVSPATQITSIVLTSASNVAIIASVPPAAFSGTYDVTPLAANGQAVVRATDNLGATCTVGVSFRTRGAGPVANEEICPQQEGYSFSALAAFPSSQLAGVSICATRLATCGDVVTPGFEFQSTSPASRVLAIRSPISGRVYMELTKHTASFESGLRMFISRSTDVGVTFGPFLPPLDQTSTEGSVKIRGTGDWSDIRITSATPSGLPGLTVWGMLVLLLVMLTSIIVFAWRRGTKGDRASGHP